MVVRPASETPFSALALAELGERAGIPKGVFSVVTGDPEPIVGESDANPIVRAVSFTGSTEIGKRLLREGADGVTRMSMELGGHAPFILFPDVDLDDAVDAAVAAKFQTTGQDCLAANRIYVHADIYDAFVDALRRKGGSAEGRQRPGGRCGDRPADARPAPSPSVRLTWTMRWQRRAAARRRHTAGAGSLFYPPRFSPTPTSGWQSSARRLSVRSPPSRVSTARKR